MVLGTAACPKPYCSGTFGRWYIEPELKDWSPSSPPPRARKRQQRVLRSDSQLGLVKWGSMRQQVPDLFRRVEAHSPTDLFRFLPPHHFDHLVPGIFRILHEEEALSPHLHFPPILAHLKIDPGSGPPLPYRHIGDDGLEVIDPPLGPREVRGGPGQHRQRTGLADQPHLAANRGRLAAGTTDSGDRLVNRKTGTGCARFRPAYLTDRPEEEWCPATPLRRRKPLKYLLSPRVPPLVAAMPHVDWLARHSDNFPG